MDRKRDKKIDSTHQLYCDERMGQQIRENNQELRELESRIRAAYVTKHLRLQLCEQQKKRLQEKMDNQKYTQIMKQKFIDDVHHDRQLKEERRLQQEQHRKELQGQIADKQFQKKILYEVFLKEKIIIDEILVRIQNEQIEEMQEKMRKSECIRLDFMQLIEEQNEWKKLQEKIVAEENAKIEQYIAEQDERAKQTKETGHEILLAKVQQQEQLCSSLEEMHRKKLEREELLIELKSKEMHEKQLELDRKKLEDRIRHQLKGKFELECQLKDMEKEKLLEKSKEEQFRTEQLQILAEKDHLDMLTKERQRVKKQEHYHVVREMLKAKEADRAAHIARLVEEENEIIALEKRRQKLFEIERMKILHQHGDDIIGLLPRELLHIYNTQA